mmetsp:Transcript_47287/g.71539  ORF Transcript_47287/g.71539 Transcript_47287/m.71539 type:complete len:336 (+) Transcript_47287:70-1077(+)
MTTVNISSTTTTTIQEDKIQENEEECQNYKNAEVWCHRMIYIGHDLFFNLETFHAELEKAAWNTGLPYESLHSFLRNIHLTHVKKTTHYIRSTIKEHLQTYTSGTSILTMAKSLNYPPYMLARLIVENIVASDSISRKEITGAMRDPVRKLGDANVISSRFKDSELHRGSIQRLFHSPRIDPFSNQPIPPPSGPITRLAVEVMEAIDSDPLYGPRQDRERHSVGIEYEIILEQTLSSMGIPFETEAQLRIRGTARTPDILFSCPVGIKVPKRRRRKKIHNNRQDDDDGEDAFEWKVVCWIDSKVSNRFLWNIVRAEVFFQMSEFEIQSFVCLVLP